MVQLSKIGQRRDIIVKYDEYDIRVTFKPAAINDLWLERLSALSPEDRQGYAELLCEVLVSWDIVDDEGNELKPTPDLLRTLPADLLTAISMSIMESLAPNR